MKHYYLVTLFGYDDEGVVYYPTGFAPCDEPRITKADIKAIVDATKEEGDINLLSVSYMGCMTGDEFENFRSMKSL